MSKVINMEDIIEDKFLKAIYDRLVHIVVACNTEEEMTQKVNELVAALNKPDYKMDDELLDKVLTVFDKVMQEYSNK